MGAGIGRIGLMAGSALALTACAALEPAQDDDTLRVATFNASMNRQNAGDLLADLEAGDNAQIQRVAETIQRVRPDVILINEFDYVEGGAAVDLFRDNYLEVGQNGQAPIDFPYAFLAPSNTGVPSGLDLDNDDQIGGPGDAWGFGFFPGQYAMVVLSTYPIDAAAARTFQTFGWADMPGALQPVIPEWDEPWYEAEEWQEVRLSSKSHWDVPIQVGRGTIHLLASHPTPPVFDGSEDRNGRRNHDEVRFWLDYVTPGAGDYIYDDAGAAGGLADGANFVIVGDQNLDPFDGDGRSEIMRDLLGSPLTSDPRPESAGGATAAAAQGGPNASHQGDPALDTADFGEEIGPGNLRVDYVIPSASLSVVDAGILWPLQGEPGFDLIGADGLATSDHRLVWVDLALP